MVRVPVTRQRSVQVTPLQPDKLRYAQSRDMLSPAVDRFGQQIQKTAETWDRIEASYDRADLLAADNAHNAFLAEQEREFTNLKGDEPGKRLQEYLDGLEKHSEGLLADARSDRSRKALRQQLALRNQLARDKLASHADTQIFQFEDAALQSGQALAVRNAIAAQDPEQYDAAMGNGLARVEERASLNNLPPEARALARQQFFDEVHGGRIDAMFAEANPSVDSVIGYLKTHGGQIGPALKTATMKRLQAPLQERSSRSIIDDVMGFAPPAATAEETVIAMPVAGSVPKGGRFDDARDGGNRQHRALDISAPIGTPIYTVAPGTVTKVVPMDGASGNWVEVTHPDGTTSTYSHMNSFAVAKGDSVAAGTVLGEVGNTGAGTGPHLHLVMRDAKGNRVDPEKLLGQSRAYTPQPQKHDRATLYRRLDEYAREHDLNPEETERARAELDSRINRDEGLLAEARADADEQVTGIVNGLGDAFKSIEQIPLALRNSLSPSDLRSWMNLAERNNRAVAPKANSLQSIELNLMRFYEPERFKMMNLGHFAGEVTRAELDTLLTTQAKMRTKELDWSPRSGITTALNYGKKINQLELKPEDEAAILQIMEAEAQARFKANGGKPLTEADYQDLFRSATRNVTTTKRFFGFETGKGERARYELSLDQMPDSTRERLSLRLREAGLPVTDAHLLRLYRLEQ